MAPLAEALVPIAVALLPLALAALPTAKALVFDAEDPRPIAVAAAPVAFAVRPTARALAPSATDPEPIAVACEPFVVAEVPMATALVPPPLPALAALPMAIAPTWLDTVWLEPIAMAEKPKASVATFPLFGVLLVPPTPRLPCLVPRMMAPLTKS